MFKLLKELAKAPEVLASPSNYHGPSGTSSSGAIGTPPHPYVARSRGRSPTTGRSRSNTLESPTAPDRSRPPPADAFTDPPEAEVEETDEDAKRIVELLGQLEAKDVEEDRKVMHIVEARCFPHFSWNSRRQC